MVLSLFVNAFLVIVENRMTRCILVAVINREATCARRSDTQRGRMTAVMDSKRTYPRTEND